MPQDETYLIFVEDHDQKQFAISHPISWRYVGDWVSRVCEQQECGRSIKCQDVALDQRRGLIAHAEGKGYSQVEIESLISLPRDRSNDFIGSLPKYAQSADRSKIVKILCKGHCGTSRLAELNKPYPGQDELRSAPMGEYEAKCLKCGSTASDNYNWHR